MTVKKPTKKNQFLYAYQFLADNQIEKAVDEYRLYIAIGGKKSIESLDNIISGKHSKYDQNGRLKNEDH